ncbi:MAG: UvrD-helicase domain-containing protein [Candidatus Omnitrophica bacterium]|nr:UvrD-helicase domain-containing protein [Candidatus Omnitrophota bacterium]
MKNKTFIFPEVRIVEASAGSGKTYALAKRYVQLLLNPDLHFEQIPIRNILALTFTNKASFEMKARILHFLKLIALGEISPHEQRNILAPIGVDLKTAQQKAFLIMDSLIHHYNFFQVQTIDKFINALLSGCSFKIGLTANFTIKTNSFEYLEYSLDQLIDKASADKNVLRLFEDFLHHYLYLENRTGWFPKEDIQQIMYTLFKQYNSYGRSFAESSFTTEDLIKFKQAILADIKELKGILPEGTDKRFMVSLEKFLNKHERGFDIDSISDYFAREELPLRKGVEPTPQAVDLWERIRKELKELCEREAYGLFNPYVKIFNETEKIFREISKKDDVLFLEELNKKAGVLFDEDYITVEELYYRLATRFHHYLIDEFQDTSRLQWHNLEKMAEEALSTGGSLFYVGDRKQAIYGFRGGDVDLFDEIKDKFGAYNIQIERLQQNWRSQKNIVEFNNKIFSEDNLRNFILQKQSYDEQKNKKNAVSFSNKDIDDITQIFLTSQQSFQPGNTQGYVRIEFIDNDKKDEREEILREKVIDLIGQLQERFANRDIAILTRSNTQIEVLTNWLLEAGIPVESERTSNIKENALINEILHFLKFLDSPIDNLSFAKFIVGDIFSQATGLSQKEIHNFLFSLRERKSQQRDFYLYTVFRQQYPQVWEQYLDGFFKNVGLYPLYELLISIYHQYDCLRIFKEHQGFFMHFIEIIKQKEADLRDITSFLDYYEKLEGEDLYVRLTDNDAIKILTIHKSKGLEFSAVICPFLVMDMVIGSQGADNKQAYILKQAGQRTDLVRLKKKYNLYSPDLEFLYIQEYKKSFVTELNNIYVALTRAKNELYGFIPKRVRSSFNFANFLFPEDCCELGRQIIYPSKRQAEEHFVPISTAYYHNWIEYLQEEFLDHGQIQNRQQRLRGEVIHFILSFIGNLKGTDKDKVIHGAVEKARKQFLLEDEEGKYEKIIHRLIHLSQFQEFFFIDEGDVFTEQEIINKRGHSKRVDRFIVRAQDVLIVDYKSSAERKADYVAQVQEYMQLLQEMYPRHSIRGFLLFIDQEIAEEVYNDRN